MISYDEEDYRPAPKSAKALVRLKARFLSHLALAFGDRGASHAPTIGLLREDTENGVVTIRLTRLNATRECPDLSDTSRKFAQALASIHDAYANGDITHSKDLEEVVFRLYRKRILETAGNMGSLWSKGEERLHEVIADMSGIWDQDGRVARDESIGDAIVAINGAMKVLVSTSLKDPMKHESMLKALITQACNLADLEGGLVRDRLKGVLGSLLADGIYDNVLVFIQPTKSVQTIIRTAQALSRFHTIKFLRGNPCAEGGSSPSTSSHARAKGHVGSSASSPTPPRPMSTNDDVSSVLSSTEHEHILAGIHPTIKRAASELAACVYENRLPDPQTGGYYLHGFSACVNENETQKLGGLYKTILMSAQSPAAVLAKLCQALTENQLPRFFSTHGWGSFRSDLPHLEIFFTTLILERPTVFRLVQFLRSRSDDNPRRVLIRDYGFHRCNGREEVEVLKDIYRATLDRVSRFRLHNACVNNQILQTVQSAKVLFEPKYRRLLCNQGPLPDLGYQKITSRFMFDQGLFRYEKVKRMRMNLR
ncbi:hypothetical protein DPSP01_003972 [Paraphaeosphaeria sporulosa]